MPAGTIQPPEQHPDEPPLVCVAVNKEWIPMILGALQPMKYPEYWGGTLEENRRARKDFGLLINQFMSEEDCGMASTCCEPTIYIYRINPDTGRFERSLDFGENWIPDPNDPIYTLREQPPIVRDTTDHTKCDAATNFSEHFNDLITGCSENIGTATTVFDLAAAVAALLLDIFIAVVTGGAGAPLAIAITDAIIAACVAAFTEGKTAFDDYWTNEHKDVVLCAALCTIGDNGKFSQTQWEDFKHKVKLDLPPSPALDMVLTSANAGGYVGANNMAAYGSAALADCSSCDCECTDPCEIEWTFFGVTDVVKISDCHYTMTTTGAGHFAFTSGDQDLCCYYNQNVGFLGVWSSWGCGQSGINNVLPTTNSIWNFDEDLGAGVALDLHFSATPFA